MEGLERMRPWMAGMVLVVMPMMQAGFDPNAAVDRSVSNWGVANGRNMRAFETATEQMGFFAALDEETRRQMLMSAVDGARSGRGADERHVRRLGSRR